MEAVDGHVRQKLRPTRERILVPLVRLAALGAPTHPQPAERRPVKVDGGRAGHEHEHLVAALIDFERARWCSEGDLAKERDEGDEAQLGGRDDVRLGQLRRRRMLLVRRRRRRVGRGRLALEGERATQREAGERLDALLHRRRAQHRPPRQPTAASALGEKLEDLADLRLEAEVHQPIRLVQHEPP